MKSSYTYMYMIMLYIYSIDCILYVLHCTNMHLPIINLSVTPPERVCGTAACTDSQWSK